MTPPSHMHHPPTRQHPHTRKVNPNNRQETRLAHARYFGIINTLSCLFGLENISKSHYSSMAFPAKHSVLAQGCGCREEINVFKGAAWRGRCGVGGINDDVLTKRVLFMMEYSQNARWCCSASYRKWQCWPIDYRLYTRANSQTIISL